jgi:PAS domain-containing protein
MKQALTLFYMCAAVGSVLTALILLRRRHAPGARWLIWMVLAAGFWALFDALELQANTPAGKRLVAQFQYLGIVSVSPLLLHAALELAHMRTRITGWLVPAVWAIPAATLLVAWTSHWHGWLWTSISIPDSRINVGVYQYGWWFWLFASHSYLLLMVGSGLLLSATRRVSGPFRLPLTAILIAVLLPWAGNTAYILKLGPVPGINWFSISILMSGGIFAWATTKRGLFDLLPRARETLVESMQDAVLISDRDEHIVYSNDAASAMLSGFIDADEKVPPELREVVHSGLTVVESPESRHAEVALLSGRHWFDVRVDPVWDRWNEMAGRIWVVRDITRRKVLEAEKDTLVAELESALGTVRTLEGILPICAGCRKVREHDDSWSAIDTYVGRHTGVAFTHSLCPDCVTRLYGEHLE